MKSALLLSVLCLNASGSLFAGVFEHQIRYFDTASHLEQCQQRAQDVAVRFTELTNVEVVAAGCTVNQVESSQLDLKLLYRAESRLRFATNYDMSSTESRDSYKSFAECQADLTKQVEIFKEATELTPFVAFCYQSYRFSSAADLVIQSVGIPAKRAVTTGTDIFGTPHYNWQGLYDEVLSNLRDKDITVAKVALRPVLAFVTLRLHLYATKDYRIDHLDDIVFESFPACIDRLPSVKDWTNDLGNRPLAVFCDGDSNGLSGVRLNIVSLLATGEKVSYKRLEVPSIHRTRVDCEATLPQIEARLLDSGVEVFSSLCAYDRQDKSYSAQAFHK